MSSRSDNRPARADMPDSASESKQGDLKPASARLGRDVQARIGEQLRSMYDGFAQAPVPDRFMELLARMQSTDVKSNDPEQR